VPAALASSVGGGGAAAAADAADSGSGGAGGFSPPALALSADGARPLSSLPTDAVSFRAGLAPYVLLPATGVTVETTRAGDATAYAENGSFVRIHYEARILGADGVAGPAFDSSERRGVPFDFQIGAGFVLAALEDAILLMSRGQAARVVLPPAAAYGDRGHPPVVPPQATLEYTVELIAIQH